MEQIRIDLVPGGVTPNAHASQYDVGRGIRFLLYNGGNSYTLAGTETITVDVTKPDGTTDTVSVTNTSSNYVDFVTTDGLLNQAGLYPCEISIVDGGTEIGSQNFNLRAEADAYDGADIVTVTVGPADICTFTTTLAEPLQSVKVNVLATGGNGTPDNPIPINGFTEANITRCGVNLFDKAEVMDGYISDANGNYTYSNNRKCTDFIPIKGGESYKISSEQEDSAWGAWYDSEKNYISGCAGYYVGGSTVKTAPANACFVRLTVWSNSSGNIDTFGLNYPATDTTYHAYNGMTYAVSFGQTVYGGVLDVTRGKLRVTYGIVALGDLNYTAGLNSDGTTYTMVSSNLESLVKHTPDAELANIVCSVYSPVTRNQTYNSVVGISINRYGDVYVYDTNYNTNTSMTAFKNDMSSANAELAYELATPFDIDLTPEVISAVVGTNNVYGDCGQTTVKYLKAGA